MRSEMSDTHLHVDKNNLQDFIAAEHERTRHGAELDQRFLELAKLTKLCEEHRENSVRFSAEEATFRAEITQREKKITQLERQIHELTLRSAELEVRLNEVNNSFFWKLSKPLRSTINRMRALK